MERPALHGVSPPSRGLGPQPHAEGGADGPSVRFFGSHPTSLTAEFPSAVVTSSAGTPFEVATVSLTVSHGGQFVKSTTERFDARNRKVKVKLSRKLPFQVSELLVEVLAVSSTGSLARTWVLRPVDCERFPMPSDSQRQRRVPSSVGAPSPHPSMQWQPEDLAESGFLVPRTDRVEASAFQSDRMSSSSMEVQGALSPFQFHGRLPAQHHPELDVSRQIPHLQDDALPPSAFPVRAQHSRSLVQRSRSPSPQPLDPAGQAEASRGAGRKRRSRSGFGPEPSESSTSFTALATRASNSFLDDRSSESGRRESDKHEESRRADNSEEEEEEYDYDYEYDDDDGYGYGYDNGNHNERCSRSSAGSNNHHYPDRAASSPLSSGGVGEGALPLSGPPLPSQHSGAERDDLQRLHLCVARLADSNNDHLDIVLRILSNLQGLERAQLLQLHHYTESLRISPASAAVAGPGETAKLPASGSARQQRFDAVAATLCGLRRDSRVQGFSGEGYAVFPAQAVAALYDAHPTRRTLSWKVFAPEDGWYRLTLVFHCGAAPWVLDLTANGRDYEPLRFAVDHHQWQAATAVVHLAHGANAVVLSSNVGDAPREGNLLVDGMVIERTLQGGVPRSLQDHHAAHPKHTPEPQSANAGLSPQQCSQFVLEVEQVDEGSNGVAGQGEGEGSRGEAGGEEEKQQEEEEEEEAEEEEKQPGEAEATVKQYSDGNQPAMNDTPAATPPIASPKPDLPSDGPAPPPPVQAHADDTPANNTSPGEAENLPDDQHQQQQQQQQQQQEHSPKA